MDYEPRKQGHVVTVGKPSDGKVAIIGMGSAGYRCAEALVKKGYEVTIFESKPTKNEWQEKLDGFERAGVTFVLNKDIGKNKMVDALFEEGFGAVFIDIDSGIDAEMKDIPGVNLSGVYNATDFLTRANMENTHEPLEIGRRVVVIGCGGATSECLHSVMKLGSEDVTCLCRHSEEEIPFEGKGKKSARVEGAKYRFLTQPVKFIAGADGKLAAVECVELRPDIPDASGFRKLIPVEGSNFSVAADTAILSNTVGPISREGVFTSVNYVSSPDLLGAAASGRNAALTIEEYLKNKK